MCECDYRVDVNFLLVLVESSLVIIRLIVENKVIFVKKVKWFIDFIFLGYKNI